MTTLMWEAVAARIDEVVAWAVTFRSEGLEGSEVYVSDDDDRVVLITHWHDEAAASAANFAPPAGTLAREPRAWRFRRVR